VEVAVNYKLYDNSLKIKSEGEAKASLDEQYLTLTVQFGEPIFLAYTDIVGIYDYDYKIDLFLSSKEKLNLWGLGYQYEDFLFQLYKLRNEVLLKYLLMQESQFQPGFEAKYSQTDSNGQVSQSGNCQIRLYETALIVLPQKSDPIRIPYCYITNVNKQDYKLTVTNEFMEKTELSMLGGNFDPFAKALSEAINKMMLRTNQTIKELIPEANPIIVNRIASLIKDGRAGRRGEIEQLSSDFWARLTKKIDAAGLTLQYEFLNSLAAKAQVCVGVKRGLMGDLTGTYMWLLFPLVKQKTDRLDNVVALEAFNIQEESEGKEQPKERSISEDSQDSDQTPDSEQALASTGATYFFKVTSRNTYPQATDETLLKELDSFIKNINRSMIEINFRREPIYLSETQLDNPKYVQYRFAINKIPSLKTLRTQFIGRVIHSSIDQWKEDVNNLLTFNTNSLDDNQKYRKGDK
jgi:hypothetical protein